MRRGEKESTGRAAFSRALAGLKRSRDPARWPRRRSIRLRVDGDRNYCKHTDQPMIRCTPPAGQHDDHTKIQGSESQAADGRIIEHTKNLFDVYILLSVVSLVC
jgi:hypothetical protein